MEEVSNTATTATNTATIPPRMPLRLSFDLNQAYQTINHFALTTNVVDAVAYLGGLSRCMRILSLYQHYFPVQWASSTTRLLPVAGDLKTSAAGGGINRQKIWAGYSERELEFFGLIEACDLFPLNFETTYEMSEDEGSNMDLIELRYLGLDWEDNDDIASELEGNRAAWKLFFILACPDIVADFYEELIEQIKAEMPSFGPNEGQKYIRLLKKLNLNAGPVSQEKLEKLCAPKALVKRYGAGEAAVHLSQLPVAVNMMEAATGNVFLDCNYFRPCEDFYWSGGTETIDFLIEKSKEAYEICAEVGRLTDWIEEDAKNFGKVITLWNEARDTRLRVDVRAEGLPLVELLAGR